MSVGWVCKKSWIALPRTLRSLRSPRFVCVSPASALADPTWRRAADRLFGNRNAARSVVPSLLYNARQVAAVDLQTVLSMASAAVEELIRCGGTVKSGTSRGEMCIVVDRERGTSGGPASPPAHQRGVCGLSVDCLWVVSRLSVGCQSVVYRLSVDCL